MADTLLSDASAPFPQRGDTSYLKGVEQPQVCYLYPVLIPVIDL
jgi:hypothetical protein